MDTATLTVLGAITGFDEPQQAIVFTKDGKSAYVLNKDPSLAVVNLAARRVTRKPTPETVAPAH